jgi:hypothetical protein
MVFKALLIFGAIDILQLLFILLSFRFVVIIFIIIIELILHYILLYNVIHSFLFGGSSYLLTKYNCWIYGLQISNIFAEKLENFKNSIKDFYSNNNQKILSQNELYSKSSTLSSINELIYSYLKLSNAVDEKKISSFQKNIVVCLNRLKMTIEESHLTKIVSEVTVRYNRNKKFEIKSESLDRALDKIILDIDNILEQIKQFQLKGNLWSKIINFLRNDSFGSLIQLKNELLSNYYCESFKVKIKNSNVNLDCLLIKNKEKTNKKESRVKRKISGIKNIKEIQEIKEEHIDKEDEKNEKFEESKNNSEEEDKKVEESNEIKTSIDADKINEEQKEENKKEREENNKKTAIVICNKSLYPYELSACYDKWIELYLSWGINVVLYNYRGYSESNGFSTISNMQTDAEEVIEYIKKTYNFTNVGVHGINLGGIPASYLCSKNKVNFCFVDRCFGSLYEFVEDITFKKITFFLKAVFIDDCDIVKLLNNSLKRRRKGDNVFKVISYDLKKEFINHNISLRTKMAKDFYNKLTNNNSKSEYILKTILDEKNREYDIFENDIFYILQKIIDIQNEKKDYRLELNSIMETINIKTSQNQSIINTSELDSQISNIETPSPFEKELHKEGDNYQERRVMTSIQHIFEKFDAGGETLLSLYKTNDTRKNILNNFFVNLLAWGSYKIGNNYATDLMVAYNAIIKKFPYANKRIEKILGNPEKYVINDGTFTSSLKTVLECLTKIQNFYEQNFLTRNNKNMELNIDDQDKSIYDDIDKNRNSTSMGLSLTEQSMAQLYNEDEKKKIIDLINEINFGNLFILNCGNNGIFSPEEVQMLSMFLINSNFIK